jgi:hypothetical protein
MNVSRYHVSHDVCVYVRLGGNLMTSSSHKVDCRGEERTADWTSQKAVVLSTSASADVLAQAVTSSMHLNHVVHKTMHHVNHRHGSREDMNPMYIPPPAGSQGLSKEIITDPV